ncbi:Protein DETOXIFICATION [Rhynchospora pubera]|uniref:Protein DETOXIFICATION n=1 Tax=Rhynchospora pubera TaxID=906938 RepID=A0AAV8E6W7_9POAL|nr:Protein DETOXIFICATION [Rhynchospora pubera]
MALENLTEELLSLPSEQGERLHTRVWTESKKMWVVAGPAIFTRFATTGVAGITQAFLGHVGTTELAGFALSDVMDSLAVGILLGMASALETLCGQSYGAKQYHMLGIYLQRSWIILLATAIIILPLFIFISPLMCLLGQDPLISDVAGLISLWFISVVFSNVFSFTFQMYLQSQSKNSVISYFSLISITLHVVLSWVSVIKLQWGIAGAMASMAIALWIPVIGQFAYVLCGGCPQTWKGFTQNAFTDLWPIVKLSLSSGAMICLELWYESILVLMTGYMENAEVALNALSICFNISLWEIIISLGFLAATGVRVANELGAGNAKAAKFSIVVATATSTFIGFVVILIFLCFRRSIVYLFTINDVVADAVLDLTPLLVLNLFLNSIQPVLLGAAIGAGWQNLLAYVNIACYYIVGVPVGVILGYLTGYGVKGIWMGMNFGILIQTMVLLLITWRIDWDKEVVIAKARINEWFLPESTETCHRNEDI